jgi:hypothetical protein
MLLLSRDALGDERDWARFLFFYFCRMEVRMHVMS